MYYRWVVRDSPQLKITGSDEGNKETNLWNTEDLTIGRLHQCDFYCSSPGRSGSLKSFRKFFFSSEASSLLLPRMEIRGRFGGVGSFEKAVGLASPRSRLPGFVVSVPLPVFSATLFIDRPFEILSTSSSRLIAVTLSSTSGSSPPVSDTSISLICPAASGRLMGVEVEDEELVDCCAKVRAVADV